MKYPEVRVRVYTTPNGRCPFDDWLLALRDVRARARIRARIARVREGNFGDVKPLGDGLHELRVHHGPGYRIYFARQGRTVVILLCGGDKQTQPRDIARAKRYWRAHRDANHPLS
ncbi:MAG: type II toxin-antitoxin system RelE/ParE family toxin [Polyangiales bacterium]